MCSNRKHTTKELERYIHLYLEEEKESSKLREKYGSSLGEATFE